ncbi:MAG: MotA/TolQ/ExbB proton channel family protein [Bacteroidota bacterium]|nr:MotA/TolQ/ExbB proton channel family protein [Bacteroidota bacterium]
MIELLIPLILIGAWTIFSIIYIRRFKNFQIDKNRNKKSLWNNQYIFDSIPSVFPTLGILCTALGITIGIWSFDAKDIQSSIPQLLGGLKLAFIATILGIVGLIIFQKWNSIIQKKIDDDPDRPIKETDELSAISNLTFAVQQLNKDNKIEFENLIKSFGNDIELKVSAKLSTLENEIINLQKAANENQITSSIGHRQIVSETTKSKEELVEQLKEFRKEQKETSDRANSNTSEIITAMSSNNNLISKKFDEFTELLAKNNTEALVEVMKTATEQFNNQMRDLIDRLVQENFAELNTSVQNLNNWQKENKEQIAKLTNQFIDVSENLQISSKTLSNVAKNTNELTKDNGKLNELIVSLQNVLINDTKFAEMTDKIDRAITSIKLATDEFEEITSNVNNWANKQSTFNDKIQTVIVQLEEFKNFNGTLWDSYRNEMSISVGIIKEASETLNSDLTEINSQFYNRLNDTLTNLDELIQRFMEGRR